MKRWSLSRKLATVMVCLALAPTIVLGLMILTSVSRMEKEQGRELEMTVSAMADKIDRNLFERYGDAQAFAANPVLLDREQWYQPGADRNRIVQAANRYVALYGFYLLTIVIDRDGKVIAVNDRGPDGQPVDTAYFYSRSFRDAPWREAVLAGRFLTGAGNLTGTYVEDAYLDQDAQRVYGDGLALSFSAPIKDHSGAVVAVWHNVARFSLVEEIFQSSYLEMANRGWKSAELSLLDRKGVILVDYDPSSTGPAIKHDYDVLLKLNLAERGVAAAGALVRGESGNGRAMHARKNLWQVAGYWRSRGALGFPGLGWGVLVRLDEQQALAAYRAIKQRLLLIVALSLVVLTAVALWLGRSTAAPLLDRASRLLQAAELVNHAANDVGDIGRGLSSAAASQAAAIEQTSASSMEVSSLVERNAKACAEAHALTIKARQSMDEGNRSMQKMVESMQEISASSEGISRVIKLIDEIAFQTSILALNASVEAARAGQAGLGFAVVADEVQNLARRSAEAARSTAELIEKAVASADGGRKRLRSVAEAMDFVTTSLEEVSSRISDVRASGDEQSKGVQQISTALTNIEQTTQQTAANASQSADAGEQLRAQAEQSRQLALDLQQLVNGS